MQNLALVCAAGSSQLNTTPHTLPSAALYATMGCSVLCQNIWQRARNLALVCAASGSQLVLPAGSSVRSPQLLCHVLFSITAPGGGWEPDIPEMTVSSAMVTTTCIATTHSSGKRRRSWMEGSHTPLTCWPPRPFSAAGKLGSVPSPFLTAKFPGFWGKLGYLQIEK
jgi:hypothetical protein